MGSWACHAGIPASTTSFFALVVGAVLALPVALVTAPHEAPGTRAVLAVIMLGLVCTALGYMLYYSLINQIGGQRAALANYLTPAFALFYGVLLLGESLQPEEIIGLAMVVVGAEVTLRGGRGRPRGKNAKIRYPMHPPFH